METTESTLARLKSKSVLKEIRELPEFSRRGKQSGLVIRVQNNRAKSYAQPHNETVLVKMPLGIDKATEWTSHPPLFLSKDWPDCCGHHFRLPPSTSNSRLSASVRIATVTR